MMKTIKIHSLNRREFIHSAGLGALGLGLCGNLGHAQEVYGVPQAPAPEQKQVYGIWRYVGSVYYFDPIGLYVQPGDTVGFVIVFSSGRTPTVTAYHPENDNHELRIPEAAQPFDSGEVVSDPREPAFRWTFEEEGTYDYYSKFEEGMGMAGRIVVGKPGGPGEKPWGYGNREGRRVVPPAVLKRAELMDSQEIVRQKAVNFPYEEFSTPYPLW